MHSVHFCRCNLHGACGGKAMSGCRRCRWRRCNLHGACGGKGSADDKPGYFAFAAICTERVEAKPMIVSLFIAFPIVICTERVETKRSHTHVFSPFGLLQSAQSMWGQRGMASLLYPRVFVAICTQRVEAKGL